MYGTLLPGPDIGKRCAGIMRDVAAAGFENGIHTWDISAGKTVSPTPMRPGRNPK